jgi:hypothetical protein
MDKPGIPSDLLGLTCVRYGEATSAAEMRVVNQKLRKAIESEGRVARIEGPNEVQRRA